MHDRGQRFYKIGKMGPFSLLTGDDYTDQQAKN